MSIRLVVTITAAPGMGSELAKAYEARCTEVMKERSPTGNSASRRQPFTAPAVRPET